MTSIPERASEPLSTVKRLYQKLFKRKKAPSVFSGSADYWEGRYSAGGTSGTGSYARFAEFKAEVLNSFVADHDVATVIEFGCGDGNQLKLARYPEYMGFDVSNTAVSLCQQTFKGDAHKSFHLVSEYNGQKADLTLSLDVIYHLVEDNVFEEYMQRLFGASNKYVIVYASDSDDNETHADLHVRHRKFTQWIQEHQKNWSLLERIPNRYPYRGDHRKGSFADFFIYAKNTTAAIDE